MPRAEKRDLRSLHEKNAIHRSWEDSQLMVFKMTKEVEIRQKKITQEGKWKGRSWKAANVHGGLSPSTFSWICSLLFPQVTQYVGKIFYLVTWEPLSFQTYQQKYLQFHQFLTPGRDTSMPFGFLSCVQHKL